MKVSLGPLLIAVVAVGLILPTQSAQAKSPKLPLNLPAGAQVIDSSISRQASWWAVGYPEDYKSTALVARIQIPPEAAGRGFRQYARELEKTYEKTFSGYGLDAFATVRKKSYTISGSMADPYGGPGYTFYAKGRLGSRRFLNYVYVFTEKGDPRGEALLSAVKALKAPK